MKTEKYTITLSAPLKKKIRGVLHEDEAAEAEERLKERTRRLIRSKGGMFGMIVTMLDVGDSAEINGIKIARNR